jgi:hypothetical protein
MPEGSEQAKYLANFRKTNPNYNPNSNTYNPGWRDHPNFGWKDNPTPNQSQTSQQPNNQQATQPRKPSPLEDTLCQFMKMTQGNFEAMKVSQDQLKLSQEISNKNQEASIKNLETQIGQLSRQFSASQNQGFEGNTKDNPRKEQVNAITLRSRVVPTPEEVAKPRKVNIDEGEVENKVVENEVEGEVENLREGEDNGVVENESSEEKSQKEGDYGDLINKKKSLRKEKNQEVPNVKLPYPIKKKKVKTKDHLHFKKFMKMLNSLQVNIPLVEALEQMPIYAKFMKDLLTKKRKPLDDETVDITEEVSAIIQRKLPQKKKDPESFTIPCSIGNITVARALCDLGASINLMPLSMMKRMLEQKRF